MQIFSNQIQEDSLHSHGDVRTSIKIELSKQDLTFTTTSLAGPIPSPAQTSSISAYTFKTTNVDSSKSDTKTEELKLKESCLGPLNQKYSLQTADESNSSCKCDVLYKNFGNGLSFCNTKYSPLDSLFTTYNWNSDGIDSETVNEDILMEFIEDLDLQENEELPEIEINWADLTNFLNCMS